MFNFHFCSDFECTININGVPLGFLEPQSDKLGICTQGIKKFCVSVMPMVEDKNKNLIPYSFYVKIENGKAYALSELVCITAYPDNNIELELLPLNMQRYHPPEILKQITLLGNTLVTVYNDTEQRIMVENSKILLNYTLCAELKEATIDNFNENSMSFIRVTGKTKEELDYLLLINSKDNTVKIELATDKIEINGSVITGLSKYSDMAHHGLVSKYKLSELTEPIETYTVYIEDAPRKCTNVKLIPYAFFEAVQCKNFSLAREYLTRDLAGILDDRHLQEFFGEFNEITYNKYKQDNDGEIALIYGKRERTVKIFKITMSDTLIENIETK